MWLVKGGAITLLQADRLEVIYAHRHDLTHDLGKYLVDPDFEPDLSLFGDALEILRAIHTFWIQIEIDTGWLDPYGAVSADEVMPGVLLLLDMCIDAYVAGIDGGATEEATAAGA